jgi:hypothetical protein
MRSTKAVLAGEIGELRVGRVALHRREISGLILVLLGFPWVKWTG